MSMTAKDKKLIIIAGACLLAFALIMFGIKPAITGFSAASAKKAELQAKKTTMETEINNLSNYKTQLESAKANYQVAADRVYGTLTNDKIHDAVVNDLITPCGLKTVSFAISGVTKTNIVTYKVSTNENGSPVGTGGVDNTNDAKVRVATLSVNVFGTKDQIVTLLNTINADEGLCLLQTNFQDTAEGTTCSVEMAMVLSETF